MLSEFALSWSFFWLMLVGVLYYPKYGSCEVENGASAQNRSGF
jgi:hypothetical protein